ncbi:hypothetical protein P7C70_g5521, partial [Phenoliferia sp. Uapishka_3]
MSDSKKKSGTGKGKERRSPSPYRSNGTETSISDFRPRSTVFIQELTARSHLVSLSHKRRTLSRPDVAQAISKSDQFDFLIDIVPRDDDGEVAGSNAGPSGSSKKRKSTAGNGGKKLDEEIGVDEIEEEEAQDEKSKRFKGSDGHRFAEEQERQIGLDDLGGMRNGVDDGVGEAELEQAIQQLKQEAEQAGFVNNHNNEAVDWNQGSFDYGVAVGEQGRLSVVRMREGRQAASVKKASS